MKLLTRVSSHRVGVQAFGVLGLRAWGLAVYGVTV